MFQFIALAETVEEYFQKIYSGFFFRFEKACNFQLYTIQITVDSYVWTVERRYRDFDNLDQVYSL